MTDGAATTYGLSWEYEKASPLTTQLKKIIMNKDRAITFKEQGEHCTRKVLYYGTKGMLSYGAQVKGTHVVSA